MKPEKPALGISRSNTWPVAQVYHVECSCTDPDHAVDAWIEIGTEEDIHDEIEVTFYVRTDFQDWRSFFKRIKLAWRVLTGRGYEQQHSLLLKKQAALNFGAAIEQAIEDLENADS